MRNDQVPASDGHGASRGDDLRKLHVEITTRCNLACAMCLRNEWDGAGDDMAPDTFRGLVDQFAALGSAATIQFGGVGEPLCHPSVVDFVRSAAEAGLATELVTNGLLLSRDLGLALIDAGLGRLIISACSEDGLHAQAHRNASALRRATLGGGSRFPRLVLHAVLTRSRLRMLPQLRSVAMAIGAGEISLSHLLPHNEAMAGEALYGSRLPAAGASPETPANPWQPRITLPAIEWRPDEVPAIARLLAGQSNVTLGRTRIDFGRSLCPFVVEGRAAVDWQGDLAPCLPLLHTHPVVTRQRSRIVKAWHIGNVGRSPLQELWRSPPYAGFRTRVREFSFPPCPNCGGCELAESNDQDCYGNPFPTCGDCLYARGLVRCP